MLSQSAPVGADEIIRRARALIPALARRAPTAAKQRMVHAETIAELQEAGLFRILQPKRWGGYEMDVRTCFEVELALAEGDMSVAWIYGTVGVHPWLLGLIDDRAARDVWGEDTAVLVCSSLAPMGKAVAVDGGFRLSGHWKYSSGCEHCDWSFLGAIVSSERPGPPDQRLFLLPRTDYEIIDTWNVPGLRATGSHDIVVKDAFVPAYRVQKLADNFNLTGAGLEVNTAPLYRLPFGLIFVRAVSNPAIGALTAMLDAFIAYGSDRVSRAGGKTAENPVALLLVAETAASLDEMKTILFRDFEHLMRHAEQGTTPPMNERLAYKFYSSWVPERCSLLAARLFKATGAAGLSSDLPFGRILNDIAAGRQHLAVQYEYYGRNWGATMFGLEAPRDLML
jgi:3-hydroxy-9,10-secoandrosta-1,3,5(10)-triene-9,17-dione monooxygenase